VASPPNPLLRAIRERFAVITAASGAVFWLFPHNSPADTTVCINFQGHHPRRSAFYASNDSRWQPHTLSWQRCQPFAPRVACLTTNTEKIF
jgi:hypothetical protein